MSLDAVVAEFPRLETERFLPRPVTPDDAKLIYRCLSNDEASRHLRHYLYIPHRNAYEDALMFGMLATDGAWREV